MIIFDCDGVLVDSEVLACAVQAEIFTSAGYSISADEVMQRFVGRSAADMRAAVEEELGRPLPEDYPKRCAAAMEDAFRAGLAAVDGMPDLLARLQAAGQPICVASSSSPERLDLTLGLTGLLAYVQPQIFSAMMVPRGKPAPDLFLFAASRMGAEPGACLVIEDSPSGVEAARAAGMTVYGFSAGSHCGPAQAERLRIAGAERVLPSAADLAVAIGAFRNGSHS